MTAGTAPSSRATGTQHGPDVAPLRALDGLLFDASSWFAIDASNRKVTGVTPATLDQALSLIGRGQVATVVGRLRPELLGVDIDATGALGDAAAETLADWCAARGLWHLLRPSGGGPGRWHVLLVPGVHRADLEVLAERLRAELRLSRRQLDLRQQLRPLSAPHRRNGPVTAPVGVEAAFAALQAAVAPLPDGIQRRRSAAPKLPSARAGSGPTAPLRPLPRPRTELRAPWGDYLAKGRAAASSVDRSPETRSQIELEATSALVRAGYNETEAWAAITASHRTAFCKARDRGRRWWWNVWNRCVIDADSWLTERRRTGAATRAPAARLQATEHARQVLEAAWLSWPTRTRHVDREVLEVVLARMDRLGAPEAAIPQRDLVLDCAIASRTTVRAALRRLQTVGLLEVVHTYQPGTTDTAHTLRLPLPVTPPLAELGVAVLQIGPTSIQPPHRRPPLPLPLRRALGLPASAVLRCLLEPLPPPDLRQLALDAGLLAADQDHSPSSAQLRTVRHHLRLLGRYGLASVDESGRWRADQKAVERLGDATLAAVGRVMDEEARAQVAAERSQFRQALAESRDGERWRAQRAEVLARQSKAARIRQKAWWAGLNEAERERRRVKGHIEFAALPPEEQARRKQQLALRRERAGEPEEHRYNAWLASLRPDEHARRSAERAAAFARRAPAQQQVLVADWVRHRARWRLPHHRQQRTESVAESVSEATPTPPQQRGAGGIKLQDELELVRLHQSDV